MPIGDHGMQHLACPCNTGWNSILPAPPCPYHSPQAHNGLCQCRGPLDMHPFHGPTGGFTPTTTTTTLPWQVIPYEGKHRRD